jgi:lipoprotein-releasing system permease protein
VVAGLVAAPQPEVAAAGSALLAGYGLLVLFGLLPMAAAGLVDSRGSVEWFIAIRYLMAKRRQTFISIITGICVVGIAAGVWLIITVLSVMNGFEQTWREEIIGNRAHFTVHSRLGPFADYDEVLATVESLPDVVSASPFIDADGMVRGPGGEIMAVRLRGIDPSRVATVTDLSDDIIAGSVEALLPSATAEGEPPAILVGSRLARTVGVVLGDSMLLVSPFGGPQTPLGPAPRLQKFTVAGIFESSFFQYDEVYTYVNLAAAQEFRRDPNVVDGIEARTTDYYRSRAAGQTVEQALGFPFYSRDWKEFFPAFFQALKSERVMMFMLLAMIMVVAAFSIVSTLVMMIMEKSSDIAILKAMGAEDASIERIFAIEGTLIGLVGTAIGVVAGISVTARIGWVQQQIEALLGFDALPASVYQVSTLPSQLDAGQIAIAVGLAMVLSLGATLLPSRQGARIDPVEALRYE